MFLIEPTNVFLWGGCHTHNASYGPHTHPTNRVGDVLVANTNFTLALRTQHRICAALLDEHATHRALHRIPATQARGLNPMVFADYDGAVAFFTLRAHKHAYGEEATTLVALPILADRTAFKQIH